MTNPHEPDAPSRRNSAGAKLVAVALVLGALAVAADLTWMTPHQPSVSAHASQPAAQE